MKLNDAERNEKEVELELRRMKIKNQVVCMIWVKNDLPGMKKKIVKCSFYFFFLSLPAVGECKV